MERYLCIHGHFYQPPRENPWLEAIELQDSAYPYHDWNEKITSECYATNATSRILDARGKIGRIVNNYAKISFNFGPTLLSWMEDKAPDVYEAILEADRESRERFSGHGSALAQAYNHMILPLANAKDKVTQIRWGIEDFRTRFGREPEGMWLPETAVDLESLDVLAGQDIWFTILAPHQASRVRPIGESTWQDVSGGRIDPTMPYIQRLPSGRTIIIFFYDAPISRAIAFEGLLREGETFAQRLLSAFTEERPWAQIVHIATDGETYGHHHRFGDMALAYALHHIEANHLAQLTNYGEYLARHTPTHEVDIYENSSWSCSHGIERWRSDCGCQAGNHPAWNQAWRKPLRDALDWLRDNLSPAYERKAESFFKDPWSARDGYIGIVLDRSPESLNAFLNRHAVRQLSTNEKVTVLKLLEMQRHALLMYTSCGWFFDDLARIETIQIIQYAGRALQLAEELFGNTMASRFLERLSLAKSNNLKRGDGRQIYGEFVRPSMLDLVKVGAHYATSSLFEDYEEKVVISCYKTVRELYKTAEAGKAKLAVGRVSVTSEITGESARLCFGVLHWGDHSLSGCVKSCGDDEPYKETVADIFEAFERADFPATLQLLEKHFGPSLYSLRSLFRDEQRKILDIILASTVEDVDAIYHQVYENNAPLLRFLKDLCIPSPSALKTAAEHAVNATLKKAFKQQELDIDLIEALLNNTSREDVRLDAAPLEMTVRRRIEQMAEQFAKNPEELTLLTKLEAVVKLVQVLPFEVNLRKIQNLYYTVLQNEYPRFCEENKRDGGAQAWLDLFTSLGDSLAIHVG